MGALGGSWADVAIVLRGGWQKFWLDYLVLVITLKENWMLLEKAVLLAAAPAVMAERCFLIGAEQLFTRKKCEPR